MTRAMKKTRKRYLVGVDVGGSKIMVGVFTTGLELVHSLKIGTKVHRGTTEVLSRIVSCVRQTVAAGVLVGPINYVQVQMGIGVLIKAFAAAVIGGFGSLPGAVLGGLLVGVTESLGAGYLSGNYKDIYAFILLIIVLMVRPAGMFGVIGKVKA